MGLDSEGVRFLVSARARGARFDRVATIGRQALQLSAESLQEMLQPLGVSRPDAERLLGESDGFCEGLLRALGATEIVSVDVSSYQGATVTHDMNDAIPDSLRDRFSVVIDGGSLEHVFNFPRAIANCIEMLAVGGHFLGITPANNFMGHGFYQFSPELFFRVFSSSNGFLPPRIVVYQDQWPAHEWHEVRDPEAVRRRVTLVNGHPTLMLVQAQKAASVPLFAPVPQQSDYAAWWTDAAEGIPGSDDAASHRQPQRAGTQKRSVYEAWLRQLERFAPSPFNPDCYTPVDD